MSLHTSLPKNWKDIKIDNKLVFVNLKENVVSFHPPIEISNLGIFLNLYQFRCNKEEFLKTISSHIEKNSKIKTNILKPQLINNDSNAANLSQNSAINREVIELTPMDDRK
jgi:hypothetical protein